MFSYVNLIMENFSALIIAVSTIFMSFEIVTAAVIAMQYLKHRKKFFFQTSQM